MERACLSCFNFSGQKSAENTVAPPSRRKNWPSQFFSLDIFNQLMFCISAYLLVCLPCHLSTDLIMLFCSTSMIVLLNKKKDNLLVFYSFFQCCGSGMFLPDPRSRVKKIPDPNPHQRIELFLNPNKLFLTSRKNDLGCSSGSRIQIFLVPDPGVKKAPGPDPLH